MNKAPFFSICTEIKNREKTIIRTLESIQSQEFEDFEYIIYDNFSTDSSLILTKNFINNSLKLRNKTKIYSGAAPVKEIESWNIPLIYATGQYIVICEGDDWFETDHLLKASNILKNYNDIGIYVSLTTEPENNKYNTVGLFSNNDLLKSLINFKFCPPPSETIFLRQFNQNIFKYDSVNYVYAAEYSLYYRIAINSELNCYINNEARSVNRGPSMKKKIPTFKNVKDRYYSFQNWNNNYLDEKEKLAVRKHLFDLTIKEVFLYQLLNFNFEKITIKLIVKEIKAIGLLYTLESLYNNLLIIFFKKISIKIKNLK